MWNVHRESEIHDIHEIGSGTKLYYLWVKGYLTWGERDTQSFSADCFYICLEPRAAPHLQTTGLASAGPESQSSCSDAGTQLTAFLKSPKFSVLPGMTSFPIWDFYFDFSEWHILSACAWTPALMLYLTNPCTKRKVLILTKPKGKIYKRKSLRHYITYFPASSSNLFLLSFVYLKTQLHILFTKSTPTGCQKSIYNRCSCSYHPRKEVRHLGLRKWITTDRETQRCDNLVGWGCRIHRLLLCEEVRLSQRMSLIWY